MLYEPRLCSLFWDYIPESDICFASICVARPVPMQPDQYWSCLTVKRRAAAAWSIPMESNQQQCCGSEWFHHVRHHVHDGNCQSPGKQSRSLYWRIRHSYLMSRQFHSLVPGWRPRRIRPRRTRLSQWGTWLIYKNYYTRLVRKMALYKILMHVLVWSSLELRCVPLLMMHKACKMN